MGGTTKQGRSLRGRMVRLLGGVALAGAMLAGTAARADDFDLMAAAFDTAAMDTSHVRSIDDSEMGDLRGGFRTLAFGLAFFVDATRVDPNASDLPPGTVITQTDGPNTVQISAQFGGSFGFTNSNGVLQLTAVNGNNNVINNTVAINIAVLDDPADIGTIFPLFGPMN
jgi:hypothetical protein